MRQVHAKSLDVAVITYVLGVLGFFAFSAKTSS